MTQANVLLALNELETEYASVMDEMTSMRHELSLMEDRGERLRNAIDSLKRVVVLPDTSSSTVVDLPRVSGDDDFEQDGVAEEESDFTLEVAVPDERLVAPGSPIAKYIKGGGKGRRLSSTSMIGDLVEELDRILKREDLKDAFFEKFSRQEMERFWDRPDNAFGTALARALKEKLVIQGTDKGVDVYASPSFVRRLNEEIAAQKRVEEEAAIRESQIENGEN